MRPVVKAVAFVTKRSSVQVESLANFIYYKLQRKDENKEKEEKEAVNEKRLDDINKEIQL